jgi:hypothetical protein
MSQTGKERYPLRNRLRNRPEVLQLPAFDFSQLPDAVLSLVLQELDQYSLACCAATCSKLRDVSLAVMQSRTAVQASCRSSSSFRGLNDWLCHNSTSLTNLEQCEIAHVSDDWPSGPADLRDPLAFLGLRQLRLYHVTLPYQPGGGPPGLLQHFRHDSTAPGALRLKG